MTDIPKIPEGERPTEGLPFPDELRKDVKTGIDQLLKLPRWRKVVGAEVEREKGELQRTAEELGLDYAALELAFDAAQLEPLSSVDWEVMRNTDSRGEWTKDEVMSHIGEKRDYSKIFSGLEHGEELPAPIILFRDGQPPYLIGGNTRLLACKALNIQPQILAVRI